MTASTNRERPAITVDVVLFRLSEGKLQVLLVRRNSAPFTGRWALPGGFVDSYEPLEAAARRELEEETAIRDVSLTQLHTFGDPERDPRGWIVSVAHIGFIHGDAQPRAGDDAARVEWFDVLALPELAFDHGRIIDAAVQYVRFALQQTSGLLRLLPEQYSLADLLSATSVLV